MPNAIFAFARDWYEEQREGLGDEFLEAVREKLDEIQQSPLHHPAGHRQVRRAQTRRFPYIIYYRDLAERIDVVAVMHGHRNPRSWRTRL